MRKRITGSHKAEGHAAVQERWIDLEQIATIEVTSEDLASPVESALTGTGVGWRASQPGEQHIRIIFDTPVSLRRIHLRFDEPDVERTQEYAIRWSSAAGGPLTDIVRQQWNFSPNGSTTEIEDHAVDLSGVSVLELAIRPDLTRRDAVASLTSFRLA
jgi:hypothetical protein